jgi:hypothetical protein
MADLLQVPSQVMDFRPRADGSYKLTFETRTLTGEEVALLANNFRGEGWLVFRPNAASIELGDIPHTDADAGLESPSSRLRKRIYILWDQEGRKGSFDNYYLATIGKFMEYIESRLEPRA